MGRPLFELRPDLLPGGRLSTVELLLWDRYLEELNANG